MAYERECFELKETILALPSIWEDKGVLDRRRLKTEMGRVLYGKQSIDIDDQFTKSQVIAAPQYGIDSTNVSTPVRLKVYFTDYCDLGGEDTDCNIGCSPGELSESVFTRKCEEVDVTRCYSKKFSSCFVDFTENVNIDSFNTHVGENLFAIIRNGDQQITKEWLEYTASIAGVNTYDLDVDGIEASGTTTYVDHTMFNADLSICIEEIAEGNCFEDYCVLDTNLLRKERRNAEYIRNSRSTTDNSANLSKFEDIEYYSDIKLMPQVDGLRDCLLLVENNSTAMVHYHCHMTDSWTAATGELTNIRKYGRVESLTFDGFYYDIVLEEHCKEVQGKKPTKAFTWYIYGRYNFIRNKTKCNKEQTGVLKFKKGCVERLDPTPKYKDPCATPTADPCEGLMLNIGDFSFEAGKVTIPMGSVTAVDSTGAAITVDSFVANVYENADLYRTPVDTFTEADLAAADLTLEYKAGGDYGIVFEANVTAADGTACTVKSDCVEIMVTSCLDEPPSVTGLGK